MPFLMIGVITVLLHYLYVRNIAVAVKPEVQVVATAN